MLKKKKHLALNFRLAVNMLQLIYALKKHNIRRFPTPSQSRISFERAIRKLDSTDLQLDQNSLAYEMRTRGNERVSVRQGYGYGCRYGTLNEANLLKTARTCCSLEV
jgi:hypothetical protein